ncbi:metal ABC transporter permease [Acidocella sp.]|uniref:metal ABC transporter permease n=1 Tax=Acidocella sp. TaxID=50710 RepID=UPI003D06529C
MLAFFQSGPVQMALALSGAAAFVCGALGLFTVLRGQAFAGHALADVSSAGGAAGLLFGISPLLGFLLLGIAGVGALEILQPRRAAARDEAAGILLGAGLGVTALFLHFCITGHGASGAAQTVMFGAMFSAPPGTAGWACALAALCAAVMAVIARPLLLASLNQDLALIAGAPVRALGVGFLLLLALGVTLAAMTVGAILATALLIGPAAVALRLARGPGMAVLLSILLGLAACWGGIVLAYLSYGWIPGRTWPVSFFIVGLLLLFYAASGLRRRA